MKWACSGHCKNFFLFCPWTNKEDSFTGEYTYTGKTHRDATGSQTVPVVHTWVCSLISAVGLVTQYSLGHLCAMFVMHQQGMFGQVLGWRSPAASLCHRPQDWEEITGGNVFSPGRGERGSVLSLVQLCLRLLAAQPHSSSSYRSGQCQESVLDHL